MTLYTTLIAGSIACIASSPFFIGFVFILVFGAIAVQVGLVAWFITNPASAERVLTDTAEGVGRVLSGFANGLEEGRNK